MKLTLTNLILASVIWMTSLVAQAQTYKIRGTVPFAFHAVGKDFAAGRYIIQRATNSPANVLEDCSTGKSINLSIRQLTDHIKAPAHLTFHRYGSQYFLVSVWTPEQTGFVLPLTAREKEVRSLTRQDQMAEVSVTLSAVASGL